MDTSTNSSKEIDTLQEATSLKRNGATLQLTCYSGNSIKYPKTSHICNDECKLMSSCVGEAMHYGQQKSPSVSTDA